MVPALSADLPFWRRFFFLHRWFLPSCAVACTVRTTFYCLINGNGEFSIFPLQMPTIAGKNMKKAKKRCERRSCKQKTEKESEETDKKVDFWGGYGTAEGKNGRRITKKPKENQKKPQTSKNRAQGAADTLKGEKSARKEEKKSRKP